MLMESKIRKVVGKKLITNNRADNYSSDDNNSVDNDLSELSSSTERINSNYNDINWNGSSDTDTLNDSNYI